MVCYLYLKKADGQKCQAVGADTTSEYLIHVALQKELLQDQHQVLQIWIVL